jgi:uncharacterized protein DUF2806
MDRSACSNRSFTKSAELTLGERAAVRLTAETIRKQDNREAIAVEAVHEHISAIEHQPPAAAPDIEIEPEWLDRFWRLAQDVSDRDMQAVWGRILARQAQSPSKYSARCLEALSLLSKQEAQRLEHLSKFVCSSAMADANHHFFLFNPQQLKSDQDTKEITNKIHKLVGNTSRSVFGPAGLFTDSGSGWAQSIHVEVKDGKAPLSIARSSFAIYYPTATNCVDYIGSGLGISPLGAEIFSLIESEPDPTYVEPITAALLAYGLKLKGE